MEALVRVVKAGWFSGGANLLRVGQSVVSHTRLAYLRLALRTSWTT